MLKEALRFVRRGDTLVITKIDLLFDALFRGLGVTTVAEYQVQNLDAKTNEKAAVHPWKDQQTQIPQREMQEQDGLRQKQAQ